MFNYSCLDIDTRDPAVATAAEPLQMVKVVETNGNCGFQMVIFFVVVVVPRGHLAMSKDVLGY